MSLIGSISLGFAQNMIHDFQNTVLKFDKCHKKRLTFVLNILGKGANACNEHFSLVQKRLLLCQMRSQLIT